jgi:hypothetical protein
MMRPIPDSVAIPQTGAIMRLKHEALRSGLPESWVQADALAWRRTTEWFAWDGCTMFPDGSDAMLLACRAHDWRCWVGGTRADQRIADWLLRAETNAVAWPIRGWIMWLGVRADRHVEGLPGAKFWHYGRERQTWTMDALLALQDRETDSADWEWRKTAQLGIRPPQARIVLAARRRFDNTRLEAVA